jgi:hypothetical protein
MKALDRAIAADLVPVGRRGAGLLLVPSATRPGLVYATDGVVCGCESHAAGDPVCLHRALVRAARGMAPFAPDDAPALCAVCRGAGCFAVVTGPDELTDVACACRRRPAVAA